ncbi:hypothetical protein [Nannocystis pusilla]|uniref:hypothetical protein n=1 Tax=Nannocystis pusilla TaxID=889268 RepID=UPI003B7C654B
MTFPRALHRPLRGHPARDGLLWALFGLFPLALISLPTIPIFGGTKHWLTAYPFLALAAAFAYVTLWRALAPTGRARHLPAALLPLLLVPALWSTLHGHPNNLSQYAPLAGGARGAADLGLLRGFWGSSVLPFLMTCPSGQVRSTSTTSTSSPVCSTNARAAGPRRHRGPAVARAHRPAVPRAPHALQRGRPLEPF